MCCDSADADAEVQRLSQQLNQHMMISEPGQWQRGEELATNGKLPSVDYCTFTSAEPCQEARCRVGSAFAVDCHMQAVLVPVLA